MARVLLLSWADQGFLPPVQNVIDWDRYTIVGTSTTLEKKYLRLTSVEWWPIDFSFFSAAR